LYLGSALAWAMSIPYLYFSTTTYGKPNHWQTLANGTEPAPSFQL